MYLLYILIFFWRKELLVHLMTLTNVMGSKCTKFLQKGKIWPLNKLFSTICLLVALLISFSFYTFESTMSSGTPWWQSNTLPIENKYIKPLKQLNVGIQCPHFTTLVKNAICSFCLCDIQVVEDLVWKPSFTRKFMVYFESLLFSQAILKWSLDLVRAFSFSLKTDFITLR